MKVSKLISIFQGYQQSTPLAGLTALELVQYVLDKMWAVDNDVRLVRPSTDVVTVSGTLAYTFENFLSGVTSGVRKVRGLYKPGLATANVQDYQFGHRMPFNQQRITRRLYDLGIVINNETRTVTFIEDPGDTTDTWACDWWPSAPTVTEESELPVLPGWELDVVLSGMMSFFEESKTITSDYWVPRWETKLALYFDALKKDVDLQGIDENDDLVTTQFVIPQ